MYCVLFIRLEQRERTVKKMNALEKILEEIEEKIKLAEKVMVKPPCDKLDEIANDTAEAFIEAYKECKEIIRSHMDDVENDGWIPVSERLPEKAGTYIVSAKDGKREIVTFVKWQNRFKKWDLSGARAYWKINAWKPLPEPYKGE